MSAWSRVLLDMIYPSMRTAFGIVKDAAADACSVTVRRTASGWRRPTNVGGVIRLCGCMQSKTTMTSAQAAVAAAGSADTVSPAPEPTPELVDA